MKLTAISGLGAKGPACFLLETAGRRLLLDLGAGPDTGQRPDLNGIGTIDAVIISHGHADHCGALDALADIGNPPVFATRAARATGHRLLRQSIGPDLPLHGEIEVCGLRLRTGRAGHAPGGVWLHIDVADGLLYMGDHFSESLIYACDPPPPARVLLLDASYGDDDADIPAARAAFLQRLSARPCVLPVPAAGRGPELAAFVTAHGLALRMCPLQRAMTEWLLANGDDVLHPAGAKLLATALAAALPLGDDSPADGVMLASDAAVEDGMARRLAARWRHDSEPAFLLSGYIPRGSPAETLRAAGRADFLRWDVHPTLTQLRSLVQSVQPQIVIPAFGHSCHLDSWQEALAPAQVTLAATINLR